MPSSFPVCSKILSKYEQDRAYRLHRQKVTTVKPTIRNKGPKKYPHLILSLKKIQQEEEKQAEVDHENRLLLHKMTNIMKNKAGVDNWNQYEPRSLNFVAREKHIREVQSENLGIAKRLEKAQPVIKADNLEKDYQHKKYLMDLWNENAKDYEEVTPRHHKFRELKRSKDGIEGSEGYEDDFEDDDSTTKGRKKEKLPPLSIKYSYNPYTDKTTRGSLPRLDSKQTDRERYYMYYGEEPPDSQKSSRKKFKLPIVKETATITNKPDADLCTKFAKHKESLLPSEKAPTKLHQGDKDVIVVPMTKNTNSANTAVSSDAGITENTNDLPHRDGNINDLNVDPKNRIEEPTEDPTDHSQKNLSSHSTKLNNRISNDSIDINDEDKKSVDSSLSPVNRIGNIKSDTKMKNHENDVASGKNLEELADETAVSMLPSDDPQNYSPDNLSISINPHDNPQNDSSDALDVTINPQDDPPGDHDILVYPHDSHNDPSDTLEETIYPQDDPPNDHGVSVHHHDNQLDNLDGNDQNQAQPDKVTKSIINNSDSVDSEEGNGSGLYSDNKYSSDTNKLLCEQTTGDGYIAQEVSTFTSSTGTPTQLYANNNSPKHEQDEDDVSLTNPTDNDCKQLFKVAKELAPPADILIRTLVKKTPKQRMQTKDRFKEMYELDMTSELKSGLGPEWTPLIDALMSDSTTSSAKKMHDALEEGDYAQAVEILYSCNKSSLADLKESYKKEYAVSLESDIKDKTDPPEQDLLLILQKGLKSDSGKIDDKAAEKDAEQLNEMGEGRWSSPSGKFLKLLSSKSLAHIRVVLNLYTVETGGREAADDIKKECSKNYADAVITLLQQVKGSDTHYADKLFKSMSPTNPDFLDIIVNKSEADMAGIRKEYKKKYDAELTDDVRHKCKGHATEKVLVELAGKSKGKPVVIVVENKTPVKGNQKKSGGSTAPPPGKKSPPKKTDGNRSQRDGETKTNPLSKPTPRVAADAAQQKKDEKKSIEKDKKQKEEEKKNKNGTVQEKANFDPDEDILALYEAMKGFGTDEATIIEIISNRSNGQRQVLKKKYQEKYKKDLVNELKSELSGDFEEIVLGLMMTSVEYDAYSLHEAMDGPGTTESTLIGIICTRNAKEKQAIKEQYKKAYKCDLEKDVIGDTSGGFTNLLLDLLKGEREQGSSVNQKQAQEDAKKLCNNGEQKAVNLSSPEFREMMTKRNKAQLQATFDEYKKIMGHDIYQGIANAMTGDTEDAYIGLTTVISDPIGFYAERLSRAFSGIGTNDNMLIRIIVSRSEIDLAEIKVKYKEMYKKTLKESIESECSGDYKKTLLAIVGD